MKTYASSKKQTSGRKSEASTLASNATALSAQANGQSANSAESLLLLEAMLAFRNGNFGVRLPAGWTGVYGKIADAFNDLLAMNERRAKETSRVSLLVGREGKLK